ncbi:MAG: RNA polymerase sigma factor [Clostridia bacterium]|nr:RNA polymerase sigma factor [Clostridia bacterium]
MNIFKRMRVPVSDEEIVNLYWERDERAIEETDIKYHKYLFAIAYNILYSDEDSEECLNDTYIGAWNSMPPQRPLNLKAFLTTIVRRVAINRYNESKKQRNIPSNLTAALDEFDYMLGDNSIEYEIDEKRLGEVISAYLKTLSKRHRYVFMSRYYMAEPIEKIASDLSVSKSTVNKDIAIIKEGLKNALEKEGYKV